MINALAYYGTAISAAVKCSICTGPHLSLLRYFLSSPLAARPNKLECLSGAIIFKQERPELSIVQRIASIRGGL
jgi:hypothetical protein